MARALKRSEAGLILLVPNSLDCNPAFGRGLRYRCAQRAVVCSILFYDYETWPVRVIAERMLAVFDNNNIRRILHVRRRDCVPSEELWRRSHFTSILAQLVVTLLDVLCVS